MWMLVVGCTVAMRGGASGVMLVGLTAAVGVPEADQRVSIQFSRYLKGQY